MQNSTKIDEKSRFLQKIQQSIENKIKTCEDFKFRAVQTCDNLVDFEKTLQNEYLDAKIGVDTAENEPSKV